MTTNQYILSCAPPTMPTLPSLEGCAGAGSIKASEITAVLVLPIGVPAPASTYEGVTGVIANSTAGNGVGKWIPVRGDLPRGQDIIALLARNHKVLVSRKYTLSAKVFHLCGTEFDFIRTLQRNWTGFRFWFYTRGGQFVGGANGIYPSFVTGGAVYAQENAAELSDLIIEFESDIDPGRTLIPGIGLGGSPDFSSTPFNVNIMRQSYPNQTSAALAWTENGGELVAPFANNVWVYQNGQKLNPDLDSYTITPNSAPGQSTITIAAGVHYEEAHYEVFLFVAE